MRAIVFDLDGTLVDSLGDITAALRRVLAAHQLADVTPRQVRAWVGGGARNLICRAAPDGDIDRLLAAFVAAYHADPSSRTRVYDGVPAVLDALTARGVALAILSNKPHPLTQRIALDRLGSWRFAAVLGQRPGAPLKPDPEAVHQICRALGLSADQCVVVGDAPTDVAAARQAGARAVAVSWGYRPRRELAAASPDLLVDSPTELLAALDAMVRRAIGS